MKILHLTPTTNGYEEGELIANRISEKNQLALIRVAEGKRMTGGLIIEDTEQNRRVLDSIHKNEQYKFVLSMKQVPWVKAHASDEDLKEN